ncbi:unnamed protein product [Effrenium voratum]|uniref:Uncharacterized protein n=1 Tax=Effrenium voratum TaxID=2562239 RepID=A0AA36JPT5_9DINO|nr:unnamed protein product [Effrenium voratum]CAJ1461411.1 unnamed protein product [Effrenium voratum]
MDGTQPGRGSSSDGADAGDEGEESDTGFRCRAVASDVPALLRNLYEQRDAGEVCFVRGAKDLEMTAQLLESYMTHVLLMLPER